MAMQIYKINGMTCTSCVDKVTQKISQISGVASVHVDLATKKVEIDSVEPISLLQLRMALEDHPKYSVDCFEEVDSSPSQLPIVSPLVTYKPLLVVFSFILLVSLAYQLSQLIFQVIFSCAILWRDFLLVYLFSNY